VFLPLRNEPDLDDVPSEVLEALSVHVVGNVLDVVRQALADETAAAVAA
jgi:ATP-dependent Lon protease